MENPFFEQPILNNPYEYPAKHWELVDGQPSQRIAENRRRADFITPIPKPREMFPTPRDSVDYIMETFPIVKRKDIKRTEVKDEQGEVTTEGTYRTKNTILAIYDAMQTAIDTGVPYQTQLNPPPGPPTDDAGNFIPMTDWNESNWPSHIHEPKPVQALGGA